VTSETSFTGAVKTIFVNRERGGILNTMTTLTAPSDWQELLAQRKVRRGANVLRLNPSVEKAAALVDAPVGQTSIDESRRCATFVISTPTPDRSEDVVSPGGVRLENYARNPVVYYDHGFSGIQVPIGKCEDEHGQLALVVTDEGIEGTCYFADSVERQQIFELVKQSVLRAASINLVPITYTIRTNDGPFDGRARERDDLPGLAGRPGMEIDEWELLEWSVVGIPDNPEAVRKILAGGRLAGAPLCEPIRSLLSASPKPQPRLLGKGFTPVLESRLNSLYKDGGDDTDSGMSMSFGAEPTISGNPGQQLDEEEDGQAVACDKPSGAKALEKCHGMLKSVCKELEADSGPLEHPAVKAFCKDLHDNLTGHLEEIRNCYKAYYADQGEDALDQNASPPDIDAKSALRLLACCSDLRTVRRAKGLDTRLASKLASVEMRISDVYRQAQKRKSTSQVTVSADTAVMLELLHEFNGLVNELRASVPRAAGRR
jgi:hypothetical protein